MTATDRREYQANWAQKNRALVRGWSPPPPGWLTAEEVGQRLGISRQRVHQLKLAGRLGAVRYRGRWWRYDPATVATVAAERAAQREG